jgi:hypothetical protein
MQLGGHAAFYVLSIWVVYLVWCDFAMDMTVSAHQILYKSQKMWMESLEMIRQAFREECMSHTWVFECKIPNSPRHKGETGEVQSHVHAYDFLWHHGDCLQRIGHGRPNGEFCIVLWRFTATAWKSAKTSCQSLVVKEMAVASWEHVISHFLFHQGIFNQKLHNCHPTPTLLAWLGPMWLLFSRHFDTIEVIEAKVQMVLNTLTDHNFQDAFKKTEWVLGTVHMRRRRLLWGCWQQAGPKLVFDQIATPPLETMDRIVLEQFCINWSFFSWEEFGNAKKMENGGTSTKR